MQKITLKLSEAQDDFLNDSHFAALFIGGVGSGKTYIGARKAMFRALSSPLSLGFIGANTYRQLTQSTLPQFWESLASVGLLEFKDYVVGRRPPEAWGVESRFKDSHEGTITFRNGSQVSTRALNNWKPVLGLTLGWAWLDESRDMEIDAFRAVISRLRCPNSTPQIFLTTTPNGYDWHYDYFKKEPSVKRHLLTKRIHFVGSTLDNADNLPAEYLATLVDSYDERLYKQEIEGQWIDLFQLRAYYEFDRDVHVTPCEFNPHDETYLLCDFNISPMSWLIAQRTRPRDFDKFHVEVFRVLEELSIKTTSTLECGQEVIARGYVPSRMTVIGDAAGYSSSTIAMAGAGMRSDYAILQGLGFRDIISPKFNPLILDRVAALNAKLRTRDKKIGLLIDPKCEELIEDLVRVGYKPGSRIIDKSDPKRTHMTDALGYGVNYFWPVRKRGVAIRSTDAY